MWVILKFEKKKINLLKEDFNKKLGKNCIFYIPKMKIQKFIGNKLSKMEFNILGNYIFCFHEKFKDLKNLLVLKYIKGLDYFLTNSKNSQIEILDFINLCKKNENSTGYLKQDFFKNLVLINLRLIML